MHVECSFEKFSYMCIYVQYMLYLCILKSFLSENGMGQLQFSWNDNTHWCTRDK